MRTILRLFLVAIVLGCAGLFLIASSSDKKDIERFEEYVEQGKSLLHRQDYSGALDMLTRAQSIDPYDNEVSRLIESTLKQIEQIDNEIYKGYRLLGESRADEAYEVFQSLKKRISPDDRQLSGMLQDGFDKVAELRREEYQKRIEESGSEYVNGEELKRIALLEEEVKKEEFNRKVNDIRREARGLFESEEYERSKREWEVLLGLVPDDEEASSFLTKIDIRLRERQRLLELAEGYFQRGEKLFQDEKYPEAIDQFESAIGMNFRVEESRSYLAKIESAIREEKQREQERARRIQKIREEAATLFNNGEFEASRVRWEELLRFVPDDEQAMIFISKIDFKLRERQRLLELAEGYFQSGEKLFQDEKYPEAVDQFENAIAMDFRVQEAQNYINKIDEILIERQRREDEKRTERVAILLRDGIKYYNLNEFKHSLSVLNEGLKLDPENSQIKEYIVRDIVALKREEEKEVPPTSPFYKLVENLNRLGNDAYNSREYREAIKFYEEILLIFPFNEKARINLTRALSKTDPALVHDILDTMFSEARSLLAGDKQREAIIKLKLILDVDPKFSKAQRALEEAQREEKPKQRVVTEADRKKAYELHMYALGLYRSEKIQEAVKVWKEAVGLDPELVDARVFLARAETQLRNLEKYKTAEYEQALKREDEVRIRIKKHYLDGINLFMSGLYKEAITEWEEVLKIDPQNENARLNIQRAKQRIEMEKASL